MARNIRGCCGANRCGFVNNKCCCEPKKENKCKKLEKCLDEMSERDLKFLDCIIKFKEKAEFLDEQVEERTKEVECLIRKLREMLEKTNCVCDKTIECHRDDDRDEWDCSDFWNCR